MPANDQTVLQLNFRTHGDSLINVYATNPDQLDAALDALAARVARIAEVESAFKGAAVVAQQMAVTPVAAPPVEAAPPPPAWAATAPPPAAPAWGPPTPAQPVAAPQCQHGARVARTGNSAKGPWRAWMCPTPKGTPGQCEPQWVKAGSPEWNAFPA